MYTKFNIIFYTIIFLIAFFSLVVKTFWCRVYHMYLSLLAGQQVPEFVKPVGYLPTVPHTHKFSGLMLWEDI
jgi:hypothetical protein